MAIKIKNWKLAILALLFFCLFIALGNWQLQRAHQKKLLLKSFNQRTERIPLTAQDLTTNTDLRFFRVSLTGHFDNQHTFLLDNKTFHGKVGYEVYTPFIAHGLKTPLLVDRGFIQHAGSRSVLPIIKPVSGTILLTGLINLPPTYHALGSIQESENVQWPMRIEFISLPELSKLLGRTLFSYVLVLEPHHAAAYDIEWQVVIMGPEKHVGYAIQWFAFALTLLILFAALNRK
jgi:surfeit locus 1 family protein